MAGLGRPRRSELLGPASDLLQGWGRVRQGLQILLPFLREDVRERMSRARLCRLLGTIGNAYARLGETRRAIDLCEQSLAIGRAIADPRIIRACEQCLRRCRGQASGRAPTGGLHALAARLWSWVSRRGGRNARTHRAIVRHLMSRRAGRQLRYEVR